MPGMKSYVGVKEKLHAFFILALCGGDGRFQFWPLYSRGNIARYPLNSSIGEPHILSWPCAEQKNLFPFAANRKKKWFPLAIILETILGVSDTST